MGLLFEDESREILAGCFEVYNQLGPGFVEPVYQESLALEFHARGIPFQAQCKLKLHYKNHLLEHFCRPDFLCYEKIVVELKAVSSFEDIHIAQVLNYLKATGYRLGFLVNFGSRPNLEFRRLIR